MILNCNFGVLIEEQRKTNTNCVDWTTWPTNQFTLKFANVSELESTPDVSLSVITVTQ